MDKPTDKNPVEGIDDKCLREARKLLEELTQAYTRKTTPMSTAYFAADTALMANIAADEYRKCVASKATIIPRR